MGREEGKQPAAQTFSVSATARRLGVAPATLRTWARRHEIGPSEHSSGAHRRYTEGDLARLMHMRTMMLRGATASEAAVSALLLAAESLSVFEAESELWRENQRAEGRTSVVSAQADVIRAVSRTVSASTNRDSHISGVSVLRMAPSIPSPVDVVDYKARCTELVASALRGDEERCAQLLAFCEEEDYVDWWKLLVRPALDRISSHTVLSTPGKSPKLLVGFAAQCAIVHQVAALMPAGRMVEHTHPSQIKNVTLVFSPEQDELSLPAHVLAGALLSRGADAHVILGPGNARRVTELIKVVRPSVVVFASDQIAPDLAVLARLAEDYDGLPVYVGVRENVDVDQYSSLPQVKVFNSFRALFHEVYSAVQSINPISHYWEEDAVVLTLKSI